MYNFVWALYKIEDYLKENKCISKYTYKYKLAAAKNK